MAAVSMMAYSTRGSYPGYAPQQSAMHHTRAQEPRPYDLAFASQSLGYGAMPHQQSPGHASVHSAHTMRNASALDDSRPTLPSISSLFGIADGERSRSKQLDPSPFEARNVGGRTTSTLPRGSWSDSVISPAPASNSLLERDCAQTPAAPAFRHDSMGEGGRSPSTVSTRSTSSMPPHVPSVTLSSPEHGSQRATQAHRAKHGSIAFQPVGSPRENQPYAASPYYTSADRQSTVSDDGYQQSPLPPSFTPHASATGPVQPPTSNPWEHHHYIGTSSHAAFPQSQDRYICQTCNKAFSRPSSLKIHSHSHTGEKPFRCPHTGCGKAFSVRSNMKRHERGCHSGLGVPAGSVSPV